jgi:Carbohydrate-selective porin
VNPIYSTSAVVLLFAVLACATPALAEQRTEWLRPPQEEEDSTWGVLDPRSVFEWNALRAENTLTGGWGGERRRLSDAGVGFASAYVTEIAGNPVGGTAHKARYTQNVSLGTFFDLERLLGVPNSYVLVSGSNRAGNSLSEDIPNFFAVQEIFGGETTRLVHLAFETITANGHLSVVGGRINALDDFATSPLYCYAQNLGFCGNPLSIPVNASVSSYPNTAWGLRARWSFTDNVYSMTGVYNAYADFRANRYHGVDFSIRHDSGVAVLQEFAWQPLIARRLGLPGTIKVGGVFTSEPKVKFENGEQEHGTYTVYATLQQKLWEEPGATHQGLSGFLAVTYAPGDLNTLEHFVDGGLLYTGLVPRRDRDVVGLYALYGDFSEDLSRSRVERGEPGIDHEAILELNYQLNVTPWFYVQPDVQGVLHPSGTGRVRDALVLAVQLGVTL